MHELGVVFYVVKDVKKVAEENQVKRVSSVTVQVGEVLGVIEEYLIDCWNWARKKEPVMAQAELVVETIEALTFCEGCGREYPTVTHGKICPHCGSEETYLIQGKEFVIKEIAVDEEDAEEASTDSVTESGPSALESGMNVEEVLS